MGREEQAEEREVLDSIFPDEITDLSDTSYRISITLDPPENDDAEEPEQPCLSLQVSYPPEYPETAPDLEIVAPHNAPKYRLLDIQEDRSRLMDSLQPVVEENIGMAMVFTLVSALKENAELLMAERLNAANVLKEVEAAKAEEEENRKFQGTAVTPESFAEWRAKFLKELEDEEQKRLEEIEAEDKKNKKLLSAGRGERRLTGRQLWERGLAGKGDFDEDEEESLPAVEGIQLAV